MRIAVCDDEKEICHFFAETAKGFYPDAVVAEYYSGEEMLLAEIWPDILFLDIQMNGKNGMEIAREIRKKNGKMVLVFVTAIEEYVFQAFDVGAFHYLVKPFSEERFGDVLHRAVKQYQERLAVGVQEEKCILVKARGVCTKVKVSDIVYAEIYNRKITVHTMEEDLEYYGRISELEKQAGEDFYRTHRAYLVHFRYVVKYDASMVFLERGTAIMAKGKFPGFVKQYLKYNQRTMF